MDSSEKLRVAGLAAAILEEMGFVAVARLKGGVVSLEFQRGRHGMRYQLPDAEVTPRALAEACATEFQSRGGSES